MLRCHVWSRGTSLVVPLSLLRVWAASIRAPAKQTRNAIFTFCLFVWKCKSPSELFQLAKKGTRIGVNPTFKKWGIAINHCRFTLANMRQNHFSGIAHTSLYQLYWGILLLPTFIYSSTPHIYFTKFQNDPTCWPTSSFLISQADCFFFCFFFILLFEALWTRDWTRATAVTWTTTLITEVPTKGSPKCLIGILPFPLAACGKPKFPG